MLFTTKSIHASDAVTIVPDGPRGSSWTRPGEQWGTGFVFPSAGLASSRAYSSGTQTDSSTYIYDALNRVFSETETHPGLSSPRTTQFSYAGLSSQLTEEQQSSAGTITETKDYTYDPSGPVLGLTDTPYTNGVAGSPTAYSYGYNVHSSVSLLVNPSGGIKASYGYQPYGELDTSLTQGDTSTTSPLNPIRYDAQRFDSGSKTYNTGVRNYSTDGNHFLTGDVYYGALADLPMSMTCWARASGSALMRRSPNGRMAGLQRRSYASARSE